MNRLSPQEILELNSNTAVGKAKGGFLKLFVLAILAGAFIAFGAQASLMASFNFNLDPESLSLAKLIMAAVFPVGLMMVVLCGAELFTGNCLMITAILDRKISWLEMLRNWGIVYLGNFAGSLIIVLLIYYSGLLDAGDGLLGTVTITTATAKCNLGFAKAFVRGILCNVLVCLAVWMAMGARHTSGKILSIWFCIGLFIISGFEHSVANMYFIPAGILASGNQVYMGMVGLDTGGLTVLNFLIGNLLPVSLGNIVGGSIFVGLSYWFSYRKWK